MAVFIGQRELLHVGYTAVVLEWNKIMKNAFISTGEVHSTCKE